jgi:hypothetical protein
MIVRVIWVLNIWQRRVMRVFIPTVSSYLILVLCAGVAGASDQTNPLLSLARQIAGEWAASDRDEPSVEVPAGGIGNGTENWTLERGEAVLTERLHIEFPHFDSVLYAALWWDGSAHTLAGIACATFIDTGCSALSGDWNGETLVLKTHYQSAGHGYSNEETFRIRGDRFVQSVFMIEPDGSKHLIATINGTRVPPPARCALNDRRARLLPR